MSKTNYKRLGDYIREVDVRNRDLKVTRLMGINIGKYFMPSVANVIGTDLSNYKVVAKNQFACNLMHVGRDEKIPMAMLENNEFVIVSPAYFVFQISQLESLLPEYLMMWFRNSHFDKEAWFYTDCDVRGGMTKSALLDMKLPIPPIDQQRKLVAEYNAIQQRIKLNEQLIVKLEETAQAIYRKMFVDGIDKNNLPEGWRMGTLGEIADFKNGKATKLSNGIIPVYGGNGIVGYTNTFNTENVVVIGRVGINCGNAILEPNKCWVNDNAIMTMSKSDNIHFLYWLIREMDLNSQSEGSGQPLLTQAVLNQQYCIIPDFCKIESFDNKAKALALNTFIKQSEIVKLNELQSLILAKMGK